MDRHWDANGAAIAPAAPINVLGSNVYPQAGVAPSEPGPWWFHMLTEELRSMIVAGGLTPDRVTLDQLSRAVQSGKYRASPAGGTADAITGSYTPAITALVDGLLLYVRAGTANTTTTPSYTPESGTITAKTIVKGNGLALAAGDIAGAGHWIALQYDATLDKWVLMNPASGPYGYATTAEAQGMTVANRSITPATLAAALKGANQSLVSEGYQKLPGGLILQWGQFTWTRTSAGTMTVNFPISFPNAVLQVALTDSGTGIGSTGAQAWRIDLTTTSLFGAYSAVANPSSDLGVAQFFAIGY